MEGLGVFIVMVVAGIAGFVMVLMLFVMRLYKVGPNQIMVISGKFCGPTGFKVRKGGGAFVFPLFQRIDYLSLEIMTLDVKTPEVYTSTGVPLIVDGVAQVKIKGDEASIRTSCEQFLGKTTEMIRHVAQETVEGHLRAIIGTLTVEEIYKERDKFSQSVQDVATLDMANMGMQIVSFTLKDIRDEQGYLDALGKPRVAQVKRDAQIAQAEADRDATIKSAQAKQEAEKARFEAEARIAQAQRDYLMQKAEYDASAYQRKAEADAAANVKKAQADAMANQEKAKSDLAYDIHAAMQGQALKREQMTISLIEKEQQIKIAEQENMRKEKELDANVKRVAEAEAYRVQREADASRYRVEAEAHAEAASKKARGQAEADVIQMTGNADAARTSAVGKAEADIIAAKGAAEADAMKQKAASWQHYNQAAIADMLIHELPEIVRAVSEPLSKTESITLVSTGDAPAGASKITADVAKSLAEVPAIVEALAGINLKELISKLPGFAAGGGTPSSSDGEAAGKGKAAK